MADLVYRYGLLKKFYPHTKLTLGYLYMSNYTNTTTITTKSLLCFSFLKDKKNVFSKIQGPIFTKGLSQVLGTKLRHFCLNFLGNICKDFCLSLNGIHKKVKTSLKLSQGLNFKNARYEC